MGEGEQGLQERGLSLAEGAGWEGGQPAPAFLGCSAHKAQQGAGRLHWREAGGPLQGRHLPLLSELDLGKCARVCTLPHAIFDQCASVAACGTLRRAAWILRRRWCHYTHVV